MLDDDGGGPLAPRRSRSRLPFGPTCGRRPAQFRVKVRERNGFDDLRITDVDPHGHVQSVMGLRDGAWHTVTLLVDKNAAHVEDGCLVGDVAEVNDSLAAIGGRPVHVADDQFVAPGVPQRRPVPIIGGEDEEPVDERVRRVV